MAEVNTGKAFFTEIEITKNTNGTESTISESVLQAFGAFEEITEEDFALLSEAAATERYEAFITFLNNKYPGLDVEAILQGDGPIIEDLDMCPI
ncbi:MAG: hypothetical protein LBC68_03090 [Prevotellaceae bacterium]|jgi:hypothetical protein|nr:hypothetical protein [Prevotellaceae bacterium]